MKKNEYLLKEVRTYCIEGELKTMEIDFRDTSKSRIMFMARTIKKQRQSGDAIKSNKDLIKTVITVQKTGENPFCTMEVVNEKKNESE